VRYAGRVAVDWRLDVRKTFLALAAMIAAAACTDATSPRATPPPTASVDSVATPTVSASLAAPSSLFSSYSSDSRHWTHISTMMTDFYYSWTSTERAWAGAHYDNAMSGSGSAWRAVNPTVGHLTYALLWTTTVGSTTSLATGYSADMKSWFAAHTQYSLEKAFVHRKGASFNSAGRVYYNNWGSNRWAINPADAGAIAYTISRIQRLIPNESGVFFDESSSGDMGAHLGSMQEFPSASAYTAAIGNLLGSLKRGVGSKMIMLNTAEYTTPLDSIDAIRAGAVHLEMFNNFKYSGMVTRWQWIGKLAALGVFVDVVSTYGTQDMAGMATSYPRGNSATNVQRAKMWELSSYYMAIPTSTSERLPAIQLENQWSKPYSTLWIKAQEANIGHPTETRMEKSVGTDPLGNKYIVYTRDFDRALVVIRVQQGWVSQTYTDGTAITVSLPSGERWIPLNADGTVGTAVTSIRLRNSEAAILLKGSRM
jgi:hypothetical protein